MPFSELNVKLGLVTGKFDRALGKTQRKLNRLARDISGIGRGLTNAISVPLAALGAASVKTFADFEQGMAKVKAISGATDVAFKSLRDSALELGRTTQFTASQVAELQLNLSKLGFSPEEINASTGAILDLALATGEDLATSATVAASTLRGFGLTAEEMTRVTDVMATSFSGSALDLEKFRVAMAVVAPVAKQAGAGIESTTSILAALVNRGVDASSAGAALRNIFLDLADKGLTWDKALDKIKNSTNPLADAMNLFGKRGATVATIIANNRDEIAKFTDEIIDGTGATRQMAAIMEDTLQGSFKKLISAVEGAAISMGELLGPTIRSIADRINVLVTRFNGLDESQKKAIIKFAAIAAAIGPAILAVGKFIGLTAAIIKTTRLLVGGFASVTGGILRMAAAFKALTLAQQATVIGLLATAVAGLVFLFGKLNDRLSFGAAATKRVADATRGAQKEILQEKIAANQLFEQLKDTNKSEAERGEILDELKTRYPDYLGNLNKENLSLKNIEIAQNRVNAAIVRGVAARAKVNAQEKIAEDIATRLLRIQELQSGAEIGGREAFGAGAFTKEGIREAIIKRLQKEVKSLNGELTSLDRAFDKTFGLKRTGQVGARGRLGGTTAADLETPPPPPPPPPTPPGPIVEAIVRPETIQPIEQLIETLDLIPDSIEQAAGSTDRFSGSLEQLGISAQIIQAPLTAAQEKAKELNDFFQGIGERLGLIFGEDGDLTSAVINVGAIIDKVFSSVSDNFNKFISGAQNFAKSVANVFKAVLGQIIKAVIAAAAFAVILTLITGGASKGGDFFKLFKGNFLNILKGGLPGFAEGGIVPPGFPGDSYPALLTSGEVVVPPGKLGNIGGPTEVFGTIRGEDIFLSNKRAASRLNRLR